MVYVEFHFFVKCVAAVHGCSECNIYRAISPVVCIPCFLYHVILPTIPGRSIIDIITTVVRMHTPEAANEAAGIQMTAEGVCHYKSKMDLRRKKDSSICMPRLNFLTDYIGSWEFALGFDKPEGFCVQSLAKPDILGNCVSKVKW